MKANRISAIIVTYNRPKDVREAIKSLVNQSFKPFEIIVIDDGSKPPLNLNFHTKKVKLIRFDEEVGLSKARNYGIKIAMGNYVAFIDDDAVADRYWLEEIRKGILMGADIIGGLIKPIYEATPPRWWNEKNFGFYVGVCNWGYIIGANMAIKKEVFKRVGLFRAELGRRRGKLLAWEETDLIERAKRAGFHELFIPKAVVYHKVKPHRMTLNYILKWQYYYGKSEKIRNGHKPLITFYMLVKSILGMANPVQLIFDDKPAKIARLAQITRLFGRLI